MAQLIKKHQQGGYLVNNDIFVDDENNKMYIDYKNKLNLYNDYLVKKNKVNKTINQIEKTNDLFIASQKINDAAISKYGFYSPQVSSLLAQSKKYISDADSLINSLKYNTIVSIPSETNFKSLAKKYKADSFEEMYGYTHNGPHYYLPVHKKPQEVFLKGTPAYDTAKKQEELKNAGLYLGKIDGIWGNKSNVAWEKYQKQKQKQEVPPSTTSIINYIKPPVKPPVKSNSVNDNRVKYVQTANYIYSSSGKPIGRNDNAIEVELYNGKKIVLTDDEWNNSDYKKDYNRLKY